MRILVIDDEVAVATLLADALQAEGHDPDMVHDGPSGLNRFETTRPDAIFLDIALPGMRGIEVLRRIRAVDSTVPVIVISGHAVRGELDEARELGVSDVIEKPHILNQLTRVLGKLGGGNS